MHIPVPQITSIMLLAHMVLGCCMHHTHACEIECCSTPAASEGACLCGTHEDGDISVGYANELTSGNGSGHHRQLHHCEGESCTFIFNQPAPEQIGEFTADICLLGSFTADDNAESFRSDYDHDLDQCLSIAGSSLRTHLALRVLLI